MSSPCEEGATLEVPLKHVAEYEKLGILPMSKKYDEPDPHLSFLQKPHTLTLLFGALALLCYLGFSRDDANSVANTKAYVFSLCCYAPICCSEVFGSHIGGFFVVVGSPNFHVVSWPCVQYKCLGVPLVFVRVSKMSMCICLPS